jgi:hypothetical protein
MGKASRRGASIVKWGTAALAALAVCSAAFAQDDSRQQAIQALKDEIRSVEAQDPNSSELISPLTALGLRYREDGEPALAVVALGQAMHVVRFNYGLYSLEQAPLIRQSIASAEALGDRWSAWELERGLLRLALRNPDDPRTAEILRDTADRRMEMLAKYKAGEFPPELIFGCYYAGPHVIQELGDVTDRKCMSGSAGAARAAVAMEAGHYYARAVEILLRNQSYSSDDLPRLFRDLVAISYEYGEYVDPSIGRKSLSYLLAYQASNSAPWRDRIGTLLQIADWDLLHAVGLDDMDAALSEYARAYDLLQRAGVGQESIREMFAPDTPVALPVFVRSPLVAEAQREDSGHIDAAFELDKYGRSRRVQILRTTPDATRAVAKHVENVILQSRFRPRLVDGRVADRERVVIRYQLDD